MDLKKNRRSRMDKFQAMLCTPKLRAVWHEVLHGLFGFLLSCITLFGELAPFGLGYAATLKMGKHALSGIVGVALGYIVLLYRANGLKYLAILAMICAANVVFSDTELEKTPWLMPCVAAACTACLGFVFLLDVGFELLAVSCYLLEVVLVFGTSTLLRNVKEGSVRPREKNLPLHFVTRRSLQSAAKAFSDLGDMLKSTFSKEKNEQNIVSVFERPARQVCKKCARCNHCWQEEYEKTRTALNDVTQTMRQNGVLKVSDLPFHFSTQCLYIGEFVELINQELRTYQTKKQYSARLRTRQDILCKQYREVSGVLESLSKIEPPIPDAKAQNRLVHCLELAGISANVCAYRDRHRRLCILMDGEAGCESVLEPFAQEMGVSLGRVECRKSVDGYSFRVCEKSPVRAELGVAARKKHGNSVSGDTLGHCRQPDGTVCIMLADGMGTGKEAARESNLAVDLLIRFLESGIAPQSALTTIHSALQLKGEESTAFTTLDLLCIDPYSGESELYKFGSAPSYYHRTDETKCITCTSMPLGISCAGAPAVEHVRCTLKAGDDVILMSDGVSDQAVPPWLMQTIKDKHLLGPQEFAKEILLRAEEVAEDSDDRTVLVVRMMKE